MKKTSKQTDYKNWVPMSMIYGYGGATLFFLILFLFFVSGKAFFSQIMSVVFGLASSVSLVVTVWSVFAYRAFSYAGRIRLSQRIIENIAGYIHVEKDMKILDVGCGSGALAIACAKQNPQAMVVGVDRWGAEYSNYSKHLCECNAQAEHLENIRFVEGNAIKLDFPDQTFDAVTSNYVYHNIVGHDKQALLKESLRVLKKGGFFAIHDLMSARRYGDITAFMKELKAEGYEKVELSNTVDGKVITSKEATFLMLKESRLLYGKK
ncbi:MAG: class I SAM-dependent methyltransferase [Sphaerochaetaceae bacterium]